MSAINLSEPISVDSVVPERDVVHVPVVAAYIHYSCRPGTSVNLRRNDEGDLVAEVCPRDIGTGIISPFLPDREYVPGERVWVMIRPGIVTNLTHFWTAESVPEKRIEPAPYEIEEEAYCPGCY